MYIKKNQDIINAEVKRWVFYSRDVITSITVENSKKHEQRPLCRHVVGFCQCFFFSMNLIAEFPGNLRFTADADVPRASTKLNTFSHYASLVL